MKESTESLISKVFTALKENTRKGDFVQLTNSDRKKLGLQYNDNEIKNMSKWMWKKIVKQKTNSVAFSELVQENNEKEKTRDIIFDRLEMSEYLRENERTSLSKLIFQIRSQTVDIKYWQPWKYNDQSCVKCGKSEETMSHFATCKEYTSEEISNWWDIKQNDAQRKKEIAKLVEKRIRERQTILDT